MKLSKSMLSAGVLTAVAVGSFAGVSAISAFDGGANQDTLIDRIATDTGADRATIEASFEAHHEEMRTQMQQKQAERLQELVNNGTITSEQKDSLIAKREEMHTKMEALRDQDVSREEMHDQMEAARDEFEAWAESEGIDLDAVRPERGEGGRKGHGHRGMGHGFDDDSANETESQ